jgi:hypothetical protein
MTDTLINRSEELTAIRVIANTDESTLSITTTSTTAVITNNSKYGADELVRKLREGGWCPVKLYGRLNACWYIHVPLTTKQ